MQIDDVKTVHNEERGLVSEWGKDGSSLRVRDFVCYSGSSAFENAQGHEIKKEISNEVERDIDDEQEVFQEKGFSEKDAAKAKNAALSIIIIYNHNFVYFLCTIRFLYRSYSKVKKFVKKDFDYFIFIKKLYLFFYLEKT